MKKILIYVGILIAVCGLSYLTCSGLFWVVMWALKSLGVVLPFVWSWANSLYVWLILLIINLLFRSHKHIKE